MDTVQRNVAMLNTLIRLGLLLIASIVVSGCGQKGPLYLPGDPSSIYAAPPQTANQSPEVEDHEDDEDDDETPITIQN